MDYKNANGRRDKSIYDDGFLRVEHDNYYVACRGERLALPRKEFLLLSRLARNVERIVISEELWRAAWNDEPFNSSSLRVHICHLRNKLAPYGLRIESMVNVGYRLCATDCVVSDNVRTISTATIETE